MNTPDWVVEDVIAKDDWTLHLTFANGVKKVFDARPLLQKSLYAKLKNVSFFLNAKAECGTVIWDDDVDIAPEYLYEAAIILS